MVSAADRIVGGDDEIKKSLAGISKSVTGLLEIQKKIAKDQKDIAKKDEQKAKRERADQKTLQKITKTGAGGKAKGGKGGGGGILDWLGGALKGFDIPGWLQGLGIGAAVVSGLDMVFNDGQITKALLSKLNEWFFGTDGLLGEKNRAKIWQGVSDFFVKDADWKKAIRKGISDFFTEEADWKKAFYKGWDHFFSGRFFTEQADWKIAFTKGIEDFFVKDAPWKEFIRWGLDNASKWLVEDFFGGITDLLGKLYNGMMDWMWDTGQQFWKAVGNFITTNWEKHVVKPLIKAFVRFAKWWFGLLDKLEKNVKKAFSDFNNLIKTKINGFWNTIKSTWIKITEKLGNLIESTWKKITGGILDGIKNLMDGGPVKFIREILTGSDNAEGFQTGGSIVPGSGSGDTVPAYLPEGSFIMNRNAMAGFQKGGIPAMLEPGEGVFGPGQWGPGHMLMNSAIPRFQSGGVAHSLGSYDTGPGWQPEGATDRQGRPVIFSKEAATAFAKMMDASYGHINTSRDMASSTRSVAKNNSVGGDQNSHHLHGEATDIHGGSQAWMKQNGGKFGWVHVNYPGDTHGGHFKYTGESTSLHNGQVGSSPGGGGGGGLMGGIMNLMGPVGDILKGIMSGVSEAFPDVMGSMFGGLNKLFGLGGGGGGGGNYATASAPLSGAQAAKAKEIYKYVKSKGYSDAQAKGIVANIQRESSFRTGIAGDKGKSHGLFQWNGGRSTRMKAAVPNWATNWKGQVDYALNEHVGPNYKSDTAGMSAQDAAFWWMNKWEIPKDRARGGPNHRKMNGMINGYKFQKGGAAYMNGGSNSQRFQQAQEKFVKQLTEGNAPIIVSMGGSGGGGSPGIVSASPQGTPPTLPTGPSVIALIELQNRLNMGMVS